MFRKLVSNISFSPALVGQLGFYAKRLKREEATRKLGMIFTVLALIVQSFVVFSPPEPANAASSQDLVTGGVKTMAEYLQHYDKNTNNIRDMYNAIGITRNELKVAGSNIKTVNSKDIPYSFGMHSQFSEQQGERRYNFPLARGGTGTVYYQPLKLWDTGLNVSRGSSYQMFIGQSAKAGWFAVMLHCGNLGLKKPPRIPPCLTGTVGTYPNCAIPKKCTVPGKTNLLASDKNCVVPPKTCPTGTTGTYPNCQTPPPAAPVTPPTPPTPVTPSCPSGTTGTYPNCAKPACRYNGGITTDNADCQPCPGDVNMWIKDSKCSANLIQSKSAINITEDSKDATLITATAGNKIEYHLNIKNTGKAPSTANFEENLSDVLEYSSILDVGGGSYTKSNQTLSWPSVTVEPGQTVSRIFSVQVDNPISAVGRGMSNGISYDCKMLNTFGNSVSINVNCPAPKVVEQITTTLPHTGASENMIFAGILLAVVSYFYARSKQLGKEIRLIRRNVNAGTI